MFELCGKMLEPCGKMLKQCDPQNVRRVYLSSPRLRTHESGKRMYVGLAIIAPFFYRLSQPSRRSLSLHLSLRSSSITPRVRTSLTPDWGHATATRRCVVGNKDHFACFLLPWHSRAALVCKQRKRSPSSLVLDVSIVWTARRIRFVLFVRTILQTATILQQAVDVPRQWGPVPW